MQRIVGEWFRCVYCARDLCDYCLSLDTHDRTHFFMVFKSEVDMSQFRYVLSYQETFGMVVDELYYSHFAQLELGDNNGPPVLPYRVYNS